MFIFPKSYIVYDLETTGLDWNKDEAVEIGAMKVVSGETVDVKTWLLKPSVPISPEASAVTKITNEYIQKFGHDPIECWQEFVEFCGLNDGPSVFIGHNIMRFDNFFVGKATLPILNPPFNQPHTPFTESVFFDTAALYKGRALKMEPRLGDTFSTYANRVLSTKAYQLKYNLVSVYQELGGSMEGIQAHHAEGDVRMTDFVYRKLVELDGLHKVI